MVLWIKPSGTSGEIAGNSLLVNCHSLMGQKSAPPLCSGTDPQQITTYSQPPQGNARVPYMLMITTSAHLWKVFLVFVSPN